MYKIYHPLPNNRAFAFVSRSGTSSLSLMAMKVFYPELYEEYSKNPDNKNNGTSHRMIPYKLCRSLPDGTAVMIRHPLERFSSLLWRTGIPADIALDRLYWFFGLGQASTNTDRKYVEHVSGDALYHFLPFSMILNNNSKLFIFPNIQQMADYCGITTTMEHINISKEKIVIDQRIVDRVTSTYKEDFDIYYKLLNKSTI